MTMQETLIIKLKEEATKKNLSFSRLIENKLQGMQ